MATGSTHDLEGVARQLAELGCRYQTERTRQLLRRHAELSDETPGPLDALSAREREVLNLISEGCSNKQGALRMNISPRTFESHRAEAMRKLGARNTADLVRKALLQSA